MLASFKNRFLSKIIQLSIWQFSVAVVLVFFVCWTPFHAQRLMFVIVTLQGEWNPTNTMTHHYLYLFSGKYMSMQIPNCTKIRIDSNKKSTFFPILLHCDMCESIYMHIYFNNLSYYQSKRKLNFILSLRPTSSMAFILRCKIVLHKISLILLSFYFLRL